MFRPFLPLILLAATVANAETTFQMVNSGVLIDGNERPVTNPTAAMTFKLFTASAPIEAERTLWSAEYTVAIRDGRYGVTLGSGENAGIPAKLFTDNPLVYLEVSLAGAPLLPRLRVGAVPLAANALTFGGHPIEDLVLKSDLAATAYSKDDIDQKIAGLTTNSTTGLASKASAADLAALEGSVYKKTDIDTKLGLKASAADLATLSDSVYAKADVDTMLALKATKTDVTTLAGKVYEKAEVDAKLAPLATSAQLTTLGGSVYTKTESDAKYLPLAGGTLTGNLLVASGNKVGIGVTSPLAALDVAGAVKVANDTGACDASRAGTMKFTGAALWVCLGSQGWAPAGPAIVPLADGATIAVDASLGNVFTVTLGGNRTIANPSGLVNGATYTFRITQDGTGSRTVAWGSKYLFSSSIGTASAANAVSVFTFASDGTNLFSTGGYNTNPVPIASYYQCQGQTNFIAFVKNVNNLSLVSIADYINACKSYGFKALGTSNSNALNTTYTNGTDYLKAVGCYNCFWPDGGNAWYYSYADANGGSIAGTATTCNWVAGSDPAAGGQKIAGMVINSTVSNLNCGTFRGPLGAGQSFGDNASTSSAHPLVNATTSSNGTDTCNRTNTSSGAVVFTGTPAYLLCASSTRP